MKEIDIINKQAIKTDLALIKTCLRLINQTIMISKQRGDTFTASENEELHMLIDKIDQDLNKIKKNIQHESINITNN